MRRGRLWEVITSTLFDGRAERLLRVVTVIESRFGGAAEFLGGRGEDGRRTLKIFAKGYSSARCHDQSAEGFNCQQCWLRET